MLISDDILEERLGKRGHLQDRYARLDARVSELEKAGATEPSPKPEPQPLAAVADARIGARDGE